MRFLPSKLNRAIFGFLITSFLFINNNPIHAQLSEGDIAIIAFNADGGDDLAFVALVDIPASENIYFTDNEWNGSAFNDLNEGELTWTNSGSILSAGSVVVLSDVSTSSSSGRSASVGTLSGSGFNLGASNEWLYALTSVPATSYASSPTFLAAFASDAGNGWLTNTNLSEGTTAIDFNDDKDGYLYNGVKSGETNFSSYLVLIYNSNNWQIESSNGENILPIPSTSFTIESGSSNPDPSVGFDSGSSSENETDSSFSVNVPVTLSDYDADVTVSVTVDGSSTAESGDYTLNTSSLSFTSSETKNISLDINDDADNDDETVILNIAVSSGTADLGTSQHTVTITDDELPNLVINEFQADPHASNGDANGDGTSSTTDDEFIEIYNASGGVLDISNYTINDNSGLRHTFAAGTVIPAGAVIVVFGGGTPTNIPCLTQVATVGYLGLNNGGDTIFIKDDSSTTITSYTYGAEGSDNQSVARGTDLSGSFVKHSTIAGNSALFSPGRRNADNIPFSKSWTGSSDSDWTNSSNWDTNSTPSSASDNIWISSGLSNYPSASGAVTVNSVTINSGGSLIAQSTFSGSVTYTRDLATPNWYLVSSPVVGETYDDAYVTANSIASGTGNNRAIALHIPSDDTWDYMQAGESATYSAGTGYATKRSSAGAISFTGTINTDDAGIDVALSNAGNRFNLLGNPYTSHIDSATFLTNEGAISETSTLWVWDQSTSAYEVKTIADAMIIAPAQGFFVKANAAGGTFNFDESNQASSGGTFQRPGTRPEIHLTIHDQTDTRLAKIYYIENMTTGFDVGYDGELFNGVSNPLAIFTHLVSDGEGKNYQVQSLPPNNYENMVIPVGVNAVSGTDITISALASNLPAGISLFLEDKTDDSFTLLDEESNYSTTLESDAQGIGRYYLHTTSQSLDAASVASNNNISVYKSSEKNLRIVGVQSGMANIYLYNIIGKQVLEASFMGSAVNDIELPELSQGVYIAKLETTNKIITKKIILN